VVIDALISRGEFLTAYTPYQAEIAQGTLQAIFEFQTLLCQLTGQEVANASMYDGASALAEAILMAMRLTRRSRVILSQAIHPDYRKVIETYCTGLEVDWVELPYADTGAIDPDVLADALDQQTAAVVLQSPNFFGCLEDCPGLAQLAHSQGALLLLAANEPVSLGLLRPPVEADIVTMELQPLGLPLSYGGPYAGVLATKKKHIRQMPGRLAGQTVDADGKPGFVLTLSAREQHIRRERATSNICTNQALCALAVTIFLTLHGKQGLRSLAEHNLSKAHYLAEQLETIPGVRRRFQAPFFNEFTLELPGPARPVFVRLQSQKILAGLEPARWYPELGNSLLLCATETLKREELDRFVHALRTAVGTTDTSRS